VEELHAPEPDPARLHPPAPPAAAARTRRRVVGIAGLTVAIAALGGGVVAAIPRPGGALGDDERLRLLQQAGLPPDFPVHPYARRANQPAQGGITYTLNEPVPDVLAWHRDSLTRSGYEVFGADVEGQDEFLPRWLYFRSDDGASGAIIIREAGRGSNRGTEVKILSRADARLIPPTVPPNLLPDPGRR
jgi:hypothetical protein